MVSCVASLAGVLQAYLAHKKLPPPRTLQKAYASGPRAVLGEERFLMVPGGGQFLMSEVPLYAHDGI